MARQESRIADILDRCSNAFFRYAVPPNVMDWPTWGRRAFVLTLPVSAPLWLAWCAAFFVGFVALTVGVAMLGLAAFVLMIIASPFLWAFQTVRELWEA